MPRIIARPSEKGKNTNMLNRSSRLNIKLFYAMMFCKSGWQGKPHAIRVG